MTDEVDHITDIEEALLGANIKAARDASKSHLEFIGKCYNCGEKILDGAYCDADCRDDHEARLLAAKRSHGIFRD